MFGWIEAVEVSGEILKLLDIQPVMRELKSGGWIAVTPKWVSVRFGAIAADRETAIKQFSLVAAMWVDALQTTEETWSRRACTKDSRHG